MSVGNISASMALQQAAVAALRTLNGLDGVYDGPPARAAFPYAAIAETLESDWSHKSGTGREVRIAIALWDEQPARLHALAGLAQAALEGVEAGEGGWRIASIHFLRCRTARDTDGRWAATIEYKARLEAQPGG
jgi:hypothetical protein